MLCAFGSVVDAMHMINSAKRKESQTQATAQPERSLQQEGTVTVHDNKVPRITIFDKPSLKYSGLVYSLHYSTFHTPLLSKNNMNKTPFYNIKKYNSFY